MRPEAALVGFGLILPFAMATAAPRPPNAPARAGSPAATSAPRGALFLARGDRFEVLSGTKARPVFVRGVNLGAGAPGHFPGEFAITRADYRRWLRFLRKLRANAIRVYALHPPDFYRALKEENDAHPGDPIWLFQEVWTELPERNDFWDERFTSGFEQEIRRTVDAVHGNAVVEPRLGHASGRYDADVSPYLAGWLLGREWEPYAVRITQERHPSPGEFRGEYFAVEGGTAMECWLARMCETASAHEGSRYGLARAVSFVTWPTLDPMRHPTEFERGGAQAEHDEDAFHVDPARIRPIRHASPETGFLGYFANYHVYPYYPDFMNLDPGYSAHRDAHGPCNYAGYLSDLKARTRGLPLLIGEFGVPSSRGIAHLQPQGIHHGGMSETEQGRRDVRLLEDIRSTGCAGALLFSLFDEWFKVNWLVERVEVPRDRDPLWHNVLDPEESYGLIGFDLAPAVRVDGRIEDWHGVTPYATAPESTPGVGPRRDSGAMRRAVATPLRALYVTSDPSRIYLRLDLALHADPPRALGVAFDVLDPERGDHRLPPPLAATWSRGAEFLLVIEPREAGGRAELFADRSTNYSAYARLLERGRFAPNRAPFRPVANSDGDYVPLLIETNRERVGRDGTVYPARILDWGRLERGVERAAIPPWPGADRAWAYDPHAEWAMDPGHRTIEVAIPWGLLGVGDPSTRCVLDDRDRTRETECTPTDGIGLLAWATRAHGFRADSLGPSQPGTKARARAKETQYYLGPVGTTQSIANHEITVGTPLASNYSWSGWELPITRERIKRSAAIVREAFEGMESRDQARRSGSGARNR